MSNDRIDVLAGVDAQGGVITAQVGSRQISHRVPREIAEGIIQREAAVAELIDANCSYFYFIATYGVDAECTKAALLRLRNALARVGGAE